jgi:putative transposase
METYEKRKQAISLYKSGSKISHIVKLLKKSRQWFYFWLKRYNAFQGKGEWFNDEPKAPKSKPVKVSPDVEHQVICARRSLEKRRYSQTGAIAIQYEMHGSGVEPPPVWTINRILSRHNLNTKPSKAYKKSNKDYPGLFFHTHQMDLVGPRYIKGDGRYFTINIIDTECRSCLVRPSRAKSSVEVCITLVEFWKEHGMPDALQMDNELAFRGSNKYPRSFGSVVRLALSLNIAPVFIPISEPWRNGIIEKFNNTVDKRFIRTAIFENYEHLCKCSSSFTTFHNQNHRYSSIGHRTPNETRSMLGDLLKLNNSIDLKQRIPLETGVVYFIRFIRGDALLRLHTETFKVNKNLRYSYVVAEVNIDNQCLNIRQNGEIIQSVPYETNVDW